MCKICVVSSGAPGFEIGVATRKGEGDRSEKSDGISGRLYAWCCRGEKGL